MNNPFLFSFTFILAHNPRDNKFFILGYAPFGHVLNIMRYETMKRDNMDNRTIMQLLQMLDALTGESQSELQQLILDHMSRVQDGTPAWQWQLEMLRDIRPCLPENRRHRVDVVIKFLELGQLLNESRQDSPNNESSQNAQ